ncbi:hypothetical protein FCM35_KLT21631 [Carex littledalei]|uniref:Uncharacterized protein n=1 Tax=Carex littledalei TaxID=544730 RepID=A0A833R699_9POAL|nr:hypothetical protein FCM35_KLT21631 [Carex littledalei]
MHTCCGVRTSHTTPFPNKVKIILQNPASPHCPSFIQRMPYYTPSLVLVTKIRKGSFGILNVLRERPIVMVSEREAYVDGSILNLHDVLRLCKCMHRVLYYLFVGKY